LIYYYVIDDRGDVVLAEGSSIWVQWFEPRILVCARTLLGNGLQLSTIFLGIDLSNGHWPPLLFETIIFYGRKVVEGPYRYPDWPVAAAHHLELVKLWAERTPAE
jgi:hypothetical protein